MDDPTTFVKPLPHRDNYELYVNFLCIFACIYALAKITNIAEMYMARRIQRKFSLPSMEDMVFEAEVIDDLHSQQENLLMKINKLEKQNQELKYKLLEIDDSGRTPQQALEESIHKIYISNRHIHLNRQVYVDQSTVKMNFPASPDKRGNMNIWEKYLKMQNKTLKQSVEPQVIDQMASHMPVMMSTEELQNIRGKNKVNLLIEFK